MWILALQHYNDVKRMVEPKQRRVQEAREALEVAQENLKNKQVLSVKQPVVWRRSKTLVSARMGACGSRPV